MVSRQMISTIVPLTLLLGFGCTQLFTSRFTRIAALAVVGGLLLSSTVYHLRYMQKEDWRGATQFLTRQIKPGDTVVYNTYGAFHGYLMGRYDPRRILAAADAVYLYPILKQCQNGWSDCFDQALRKTPATGTYWIVESHERFVPHAPAVSNWLDTHFAKSDLNEFLGVKVWRGSPRASAP